MKYVCWPALLELTGQVFFFSNFVMDWNFCDFLPPKNQQNGWNYACKTKTSNVPHVFWVKNSEFFSKRKHWTACHSESSQMECFRIGVVAIVPMRRNGCENCNSATCQVSFCNTNRWAEWLCLYAQERFCFEWYIYSVAIVSVMLVAVCLNLKRVCFNCTWSRQLGSNFWMIMDQHRNCQFS